MRNDVLTLNQRGQGHLTFSAWVQGSLVKLVDPGGLHYYSSDIPDVRWWQIKFFHKCYYRGGVVREGPPGHGQAVMAYAWATFGHCWGPLTTMFGGIKGSWIGSKDSLWAGQGWARTRLRGLFLRQHLGQVHGLIGFRVG